MRSPKSGEQHESLGGLLAFSELWAASLASTMGFNAGQEVEAIRLATFASLVANDPSELRNVSSLPVATALLTYYMNGDNSFAANQHLRQLWRFYKGVSEAIASNQTTVWIKGSNFGSVENAFVTSVEGVMSHSKLEDVLSYMESGSRENGQSEQDTPATTTLNAGDGMSDEASSELRAMVMEPPPVHVPVWPGCGCKVVAFGDEKEKLFWVVRVRKPLTDAGAVAEPFEDVILLADDRPIVDIKQSKMSVKSTLQCLTNSLVLYTQQNVNCKLVSHACLHANQKFYGFNKSTFSDNKPLVQTLIALARSYAAKDLSDHNVMVARLAAFSPEENADTFYHALMPVLLMALGADYNSTFFLNRWFNKRFL